VRYKPNQDDEEAKAVLIEENKFKTDPLSAGMIAIGSSLSKDANLRERSEFVSGFINELSKDSSWASSLCKLNKLETSELSEILAIVLDKRANDETRGRGPMSYRRVLEVVPTCTAHRFQVLTGKQLGTIQDSVDEYVKAVLKAR